MKIFLITKVNEDGTINGCTPSWQEFSYWYLMGYRYIAHYTSDAITLSKVDLGDIGEHCSYSDCVINPINNK